MSSLFRYRCCAYWRAIADKAKANLKSRKLDDPLGIVSVTLRSEGIGELACCEADLQQYKLHMTLFSVESLVSFLISYKSSMLQAGVYICRYPIKYEETH